MIRRLVCFSLMMVTISSCGRQQPTPEKTAAASTPTDSGEIRLPPDSPQLKRLHVEEVQTAKVPLEEVVVPGKIEANPTRISRIAMPLPGRVKKVMVTIGERSPACG